MGGRGSKGKGLAVSFSNKSEADRFFGGGGGGSNQNEWESGLDKNEKNAINDYTALGYGAINRTLRNEGYDNAPKGMKRTIDNIKSALDRYELKKDIMVYRGVSNSFFGGNYSSADINNMFVGQTFVDNGFVSASALKERAFNRKYTLEIKVPRGVGRGAYISPLSTFKREAEFLLQRGTKFTITGAREENGKTVVQVIAK